MPHIVASHAEEVIVEDHGRPALVIVSATTATAPPASWEPFIVMTAFIDLERGPRRVPVLTSGPMVALVVTTALANGWHVVTSNLRHYRGIAGLVS
jgi:hypothetical protein